MTALLYLSRPNINHTVTVSLITQLLDKLEKKSSREQTFLNNLKRSISESKYIKIIMYSYHAESADFMLLLGLDVFSENVS